MNRRRFLVLSGLSAAAGVAGCVSDRSEDGAEPSNTRTGSEQRQFQSDAGNTGVADGSPPESATVDWQTTVSPIEGGLCVSDDRLVIAASGELLALDVGDGSELWTADVGHSTGLAPAVTEDTAYVTTWNGGRTQDRGVAAIALDDGSERWRAVPEVGVSSAPTLLDDTLYVGGSVNSDEVIAIDATDGSERWRFRAARHVTTPAVADGSVYVGGGKEQTAYGIDAETGTERWQFTTDGEAMNPPTVADGTVYVPTRSGHLYALDRDDGTEQWSVRVDPSDERKTPTDSASDSGRRRGRDGPRIWGSVAATDEGIYVPADGSVVALDAEGERRWTAGKGTPHAPVLADDSLLVTAGKSALCLDATDGEQRWRHDVESRAISDAVYAGIRCEPVAADDAVFVAAHGGHVYALR